MPMHNPPHPGRLVKRALIDGTGLTITDAADILGVGRVTLSNIINGHTGISVEMAIRLSVFLVTSVEMWLNMQNSYDLWQMEKEKISIKRAIERKIKKSEVLKSSQKKVNNENKKTSKKVALNTRRKTSNKNDHNAKRCANG